MDLSDQLYAAEERIRDLEKILGLKEPCPLAFRFSPTEKAVFGILLKRPLTDKNAIVSLIYGNLPCERDAPQPKIIDVYVHKIRRKVAPFGVGIDNIRGQGYRLTPEHKAKVAALLEAEQQ